MLKITIHDSAVELRFRLEGRLSGPWVGELRQCWVTARSTTHGRTTVLDLREVDFVDDSGRILVREMAGEAVRMLAATPLIQALVEEVSRDAGYASVEGKPAQARDVPYRPPTSGRNPRAV
jgi:hypothetical protein